MPVCKECGVELEADMEVCPLCDTPMASSNGGVAFSAAAREAADPGTDKKHFLQQILWQITSVLLLSGIAATLVINLAIQGSITWSIYPVTICMIIFAYASLMALWHVKVVYRVLVGWFISALVLSIVRWYTSEIWALQLALPILCAVNVIGLSVRFIVRRLKIKGLNVLSIIFIAIAVLCLIIEGAISRYFMEEIELRWSVIVAACLLPVTVAILFMYFRTRNNAQLQKMFHT